MRKLTKDSAPCFWAWGFSSGIDSGTCRSPFQRECCLSHESDLKRVPFATAHSSRKTFGLNEAWNSWVRTSGSANTESGRFSRTP